MIFVSKTWLNLKDQKKLSLGRYQKPQLGKFKSMSLELQLRALEESNVKTILPQLKTWALFQESVVELEKLCSETGLDTSSIDIIDTVLYAADAHELLQSRQATGSIVLKP